MFITNDIKYIGVNDHKVDLFEGQYKVPSGMSYNSYAIIDDKIAIMDTVDQNFTHEWLDNIQNTLSGRKPDYLVIQHMEPDHSANIVNFLKAYPDAMTPKAALRKNWLALDWKPSTSVAIMEQMNPTVPNTRMGGKLLRGSSFTTSKAVYDTELLKASVGMKKATERA